MGDLTIGLDAHSRECEYAVLDGNLKVIERGRIPSAREDLLELAKRFPNAPIILEASSVHEWIYDTLATNGFKPIAIHPVKIKDITGKKSDKVDAEFLAKAWRMGLLRESWVPPPPIRRLRELCRYRTFLTQERTRLKNRVHGILKRRGLKITDDDGIEADDIFSKRARTLLLRIDHPELPILLEMIDAQTARIKDAENQLQKEMKNNADIQHLNTIPGFGAFTSVALYAEIGDINRFRDAQALTSYFGLVSRVEQTGDTRTHGPITRKGSGMIRWLLTQSAWSHLKACPQSNVTKTYRRLSKRIGKHRAATAASRKLITISYWILKQKRPFTLNG